MSRIMSSGYILDRVNHQNAGSVQNNSLSGPAGVSNHALNMPSSVNVSNISNLKNMTFEQVYNKVANQGVSISKHAYQRIQSRNIELDDAQLKRVSKAMEQAKQKGIKDALIVFDNKMMIANIKNNTIVTIANQSDLNDDIITNIDGAIIL